MILPVEFLRGADADLQGAFNHFEDYREGFGVEFMTAVDAYLARIGAFPEIAPVYLEKLRRSGAKSCKDFRMEFFTNVTRRGDSHSGLAARPE